MKFRRGDKVRKRRDTQVGTVIGLKERGVAGSAVTYLEYIEVEYEDGTVVRAEPNHFEKVDEVES